MSLLISIIILFIGLLVEVRAIQFPYEYTSLSSPWFNCAGFLIHCLPNTLLFAIVTITTELSVGSFNCFLQWLLNMYLHVPNTYFLTGGMKDYGCGSSTQVYFQFTVFGGALFLTKFLFPALLKLKVKTSTNESEFDACIGRQWTALAILRAFFLVVPWPLPTVLGRLDVEWCHSPSY